MMDEDKEVMDVNCHNIKVTEVSRDGDTLNFVIVSQKLSGTGEYHVARTYEDFDWLQHQLFSEDETPETQGIIFPPLPVKAQVNASAKVMKQLGILALGQDWQPYCLALEKYLFLVATHRTLSKNKAVEVFLTSTEHPGHQYAKKGIFNRLSQAMEGMRKEGHKDVDEFFQTERDHNLTLIGSTKTAAERFMDVVLTEQRTAVACGHLSASMQLLVEPGEEPNKQAFSKICMKVSEVFDSMRKNLATVADNDVNTLGLGLDLDSRLQEAEKEMLFRRTCKMVELENATRNAERAKPVKKAAMEDLKKASEKDFDQISGVAKLEIARLKEVRVQMLQQVLVQWCEKQLDTAKQAAERYHLHLEAFREMV